jgi:hypothetical protein
MKKIIAQGTIKIMDCNNRRGRFSGPKSKYYEATIFPTESSERDGTYQKVQENEFCFMSQPFA